MHAIAAQYRCWRSGEPLVRTLKHLSIPRVQCNGFQLLVHSSIFKLKFNLNLLMIMPSGYCYLQEAQTNNSESSFQVSPTHRQLPYCDAPVK